MYNSQEIAKRIKEQAKKNQISIKEMLAECDMGINAISQMAKGSDMLSKNLAKLADCLDCSVDYLLGRTDLPDAIRPSDLNTRNGTDYIMTSSKTETSLLIEFRSLNTQGQEYIMQTMDMVKDKYKKSDSLPQLEDIG